MASFIRQVFMISYTKASPQRFFFDMALADRTQKLNAFKGEKKKKEKEVGLQISTHTPSLP